MYSDIIYKIIEFSETRETFILYVFVMKLPVQDFTNDYVNLIYDNIGKVSRNILVKCNGIYSLKYLPCSNPKFTMELIYQLDLYRFLGKYIYLQRFDCNVSKYSIIFSIMKHNISHTDVIKYSEFSYIHDDPFTDHLPISGLIDDFELRKQITILNKMIELEVLMIEYLNEYSITTQKDICIKINNMIHSMHLFIGTRRTFN